MHKGRGKLKGSVKHRLRRAGVTYGEVARLAGVTWRMVKYVVDGQRTSARVMGAIDRLAPPRAHGDAA